MQHQSIGLTGSSWQEWDLFAIDVRTFIVVEESPVEESYLIPEADNI